MKKGLLIIISGPSGVGKGTVIKEVMKCKELKLTYSISMTTRKPRQGEKDGVNYFFVSKEEFLNAVDNNELLEHAMFVENYYGTPIKYVEEQRNKGNNVLLEIETVGAKQVMEKLSADPGCISIFITPPSIQELERRIRGRNSESNEVIKKRVLKAQQELQETSHYKYVVCNERIKTATNEIIDIILNEMENND